ncbi:MAG: IS91 family transposase [Planctomycetota bacterium]|jgi:hypothetical protein
MDTQRPRFEVADVVRAYGEAYRNYHRPSAAQQRVLRNIAACRTAALGGHVDQCDDCGHARISYNSCRDRHCPKCQGPQRAEWLAQRLERLLPVPYFHVVFTIPNELNPIALRNKESVYKILFDAASATLLQIAKDPKHLGAQLGITAVLHTWGQNLLLHPHLHCVVTGGGLAPDGARWVPARKHYFLPVKVLGRLFRGKFLAALHQAWYEGKLEFTGSAAKLADPVAWSTFKDRLYRKDWVVYAKPPFGGPQQVFRYLGRYTHRVAIANHRIIYLDDGKVTFTVKDYADNATPKQMTLGTVEFLRRFLLHVLPGRFVRIRHYGLCAARNVNTKLATAHRLLDPQTSAKADTPEPSEPPARTTWWERFAQYTGIDVMACPGCGGRLVRRQLPTVATAAASNSRASPAVA